MLKDYTINFAQLQQLLSKALETVMGIPITELVEVNQGVSDGGTPQEQGTFPV